MAVPLTTLTQRPVHQDVWFCRDDTQLNQSGLFGTIVQWDADANSNVFKANFVFMMKKAFAFLDRFGFGTCIYGSSGFEGRIRYYEAEWNKCQSKLNLNRLAREKIVKALGGEAECQRIPVVNFNAEDLEAYLKLGDEYFSEGEWIVQTEDSAGRKAVVMRLRDRTTQVYIATAHQLYRETSNRGSDWTLNFEASYPDIYANYANTDRIAEFIEDARAGRGQFLFSPKP